MNAIKLGCTDAELLSYGKKAGFTLNKATCLLDYETELDCTALQQSVSQNPVLKLMIDYLAGSFMNPRTALKVIGITDHDYLGFRAAIPKTSDSESPFAILFSAGDRGLVIEESKEYVNQVLKELSGFNSDIPVEPIGFTMSPIEVLVILAACDAIQQNKQEGTWFTKTSLVNAFDINNVNEHHPACIALAAVAEDAIYHFYNEDKVSEVLARMVESHLFVKRETESGDLYSLSSTYHRLPQLFENSKNKLAMLRYRFDGKTDIILVISNDAESWAFSMCDGNGCIERLDEERQIELLAEQEKTLGFCSNCGDPLPKGSIFCPMCGHKIF
ncbi:MAG: zinc ribbon domain-containing protein [Mobilitalea sp.]